MLSGFGFELLMVYSFNAVTHASTGMSLLCCLLMSVTGYVTFTDKTQGNILNNFSTDDLIINIARFCFGANMSTTSMLLSGLILLAVSPQITDWHCSQSHWRIMYVEKSLKIFFSRINYFLNGDMSSSPVSSSSPPCLVSISCCFQFHVLTVDGFLVSLTTCDLGVVLEVVGGLSATALAFIVSPFAFSVTWMVF